MTKFNLCRCPLWTIPLLAFAPMAAQAQVTVNDPLVGASSSYAWTVLGGACLTAGDGRPSSIPACVGNPYYAGKIHVGGIGGRLPDPIGQGALRLTNGDTVLNGANSNYSFGAVVSTTPFPTDRGVQISFATATYGGNGFMNDFGINSGADGMAFFLMDGTKPTSYLTIDGVLKQNVGAAGGSLGYTCSNINTPVDGMDGGYLAVGIDEFGYFTKQYDSTSDGPGPVSGAIAVRGSGSVNFTTLNRLYPAYYPTSLTPGQREGAVHDTCRTGQLQDARRVAVPDPTPGDTNHSTGEPVKDYQLIGTPVSIPGNIFSQEAVNMPLRSLATPLIYGLTVTKDNLLSVSYSINGGASSTIISNRSITAGNGPLPPSFRFGFTSGTGAGSNVHEISCFKAAQLDTASNSAAGNVQQSAQVQVGSQVYLSFYHPANSWGQLTATNLVSDAAGNVTIAAQANWDAKCVLSGGACSATGGSNVAQAPGTRRILSWNGSQGIAFRYAALAAAEKSALGGTTDGAARIDYLRGDHSAEIDSNGQGLYRKRDSVLGDIINSSPVWTGYPLLPYTVAGKDALSNSTIGEFGAQYKAYAGTNKTRTNIVYTGANDGMLHGFRAGAYDAAGNFNAAAPNDGLEVLAFVPKAVADSIHTSSNPLDFSLPQYAHNSYVDATPASADLYYQGAWHTWVVGGLGAGGNPGGVIADATSTALGVLYALDVSDPTRFSEAAAASLVLGEWNSNNLTCVGNAGCKNSFGSQYGTPIVRLLHDGNWAVIFGNGRNSATGTAGVFIMSVNKSSGARSFRFLDTGAASLINKNGIDYVDSADLDGDHVTDYLYAGDSAGNVWRFDLTSSNPAQWTAGARPLFTTPGGVPISTKVTVSASIPPTGPARVLVAFGSGRSMPQTLTGPLTYASGTHSLFGIWDSNMQAWNARSPVQYASLSAPQNFSVSDLQIQSISSAGGSGAPGAPAYRAVSQNPVCWKGSTSCASGNTKFGWVVQLPGANEQIVFNPLVAYNAFIVNTTVPASTQALNCALQPNTGYTMAISLDTGGALKTSLYSTVASAAGVGNLNGVAGIGLNATGSPLIVTAAKRTFMVQQTTSGQPAATEINPGPGGIGKRITWVKLR